MIGPTDLFHPSPAPHFKTFQVFLIYCPKRPSFSTLLLLFGIFVKLYILLHTKVQIKDDEREDAWNTFASHMYSVRRCIFIWKLNPLQVKGSNKNTDPSSVQYSVNLHCL
jgi:hypothetical protein